MEGHFPGILLRGVYDFYVTSLRWYVDFGLPNRFLFGIGLFNTRISLLQRFPGTIERLELNQSFPLAFDFQRDLVLIDTCKFRPQSVGRLSAVAKFIEV